MATPAPKIEDVTAQEQAAQEQDAEIQNSISHFTGVQKVAALLLTLGSDWGQPIWNEMSDDEVVAISVAMSELGNITTEATQAVLAEFISRLSISGALMGTASSTEKLLAQYLPPDRLTAIMEEIRGPAGRNMWEKLSNVQTSVLANYLKNEYPQTVAVVLSKIPCAHAAGVLSILPEEFSTDVVQRMLGMASVQRDVLEKIEHTLGNEFISNLSQTRQRDAHELMAEIFNNFDRQTETRFLSTLEESDWEDAERIKNLMFTFDDLTKLDKSSIQTLVRAVKEDVLLLAMKGAAESAREFFFSQMTKKMGKLMRDDLEVMGPVRLKDVDDAQTSMVNTAKELGAKGELLISKSGSDEELVY